MAKFREFYVPGGAASNFLAKHILWAGHESPKELQDVEVSVNEYFFDRCVSDAVKLKKDRFFIPTDSSPDHPLRKPVACDDENLISETKRIKPILIEIGKYIETTEKIGRWYVKSEENASNLLSSHRELLLTHINDIWREDWSMYSVAFSKFNLDENVVIPESMLSKFEQAKKYFAQCREYYFELCERNDWDVRMITHQHPFNSISSELKFPKNTKTLAMKIDAEIDRYLIALQDVKSPSRQIQTEYHRFLTPLSDDNLHINKSVEPADDRVSYRKIFFENDKNEVMKMYDFFDNKEYFEQNTAQIMKEFKEYHDSNIAVLKKYVPSFYEQIISYKYSVLMENTIMKLVDKDNKILKTECDEHILSEHSEKLAYDMITAMREHEALGLAAPQVGENTRLMIIGHEDTGFVVCINPTWEVAEDSEYEEFLEGCLSFPGLELTITRPNSIIGTFTNLEGIRKSSTFVGVWAQAFQHECDHLSGVTFDTLSAE